MRPYQYYAVESIIKKVSDNQILNGYNIEKNGYVWHTTGSGKTLTSFKASQILSKIPTIKKVVFVVDRRKTWIIKPTRSTISLAKAP